MSDQQRQPTPTGDDGTSWVDSVQRALDELRGEIERRLEDSREQLLELVAGFGDRLPEPPLPAPPPPSEPAPTSALDAAPAPAADLDELRDAVAELHRADDQAELMARLVEQSSLFCSRCVLLLPEPDGLRCWASLGFGGAGSVLEGLRLDRPDDLAWQAFERGTRRLDRERCLPLTGAVTVTDPTEGVLVPLVVRGQVLAALYADRLENERFSVAALQLISQTASQALDQLAAGERGPSPTLEVVEPADLEAAAPPAAEPTIPTPPVEPDRPSAEAAASPTATAEPPPAAQPEPVAPVTGPPPPPAPAEPVPEPAAEEPWHLDEQIDEQIEEMPSVELDDEGAAATGPASRTWDPSPAATTSSAPSEPAQTPPSHGFALVDTSSPEAVPASEEPFAEEAFEEEADSPIAIEMEPFEDDRLTELPEASGEWELAPEAGEPTAPAPAPSAETTRLPIPPPLGAETSPAEPEALATQVIRPDDLARLGQPPGSAPPPTTAQDAPTPPPAPPAPAPPAQPPPPAPVAPPASSSPRPSAPPGGSSAGAPTPGGQVRPPADLQGPGSAFARPKGEPDLGPAHAEARRLARLLVSELKLYNEEQIEQGRRQGNIYARLRDDIDRSRQMYEERVDPSVREGTDYFRDELVRNLARGDAGVLGL